MNHVIGRENRPSEGKRRVGLYKRPWEKECKEPKPGEETRAGCAPYCDKITGKWLTASCMAKAGKWVAELCEDTLYPFEGYEEDVYCDNPNYKENKYFKGCVPKDWTCPDQNWECQDPCQYSCDNSTDISICKVLNRKTGEIGRCGLGVGSSGGSNLVRGNLYGIECWDTPEECDQCALAPLTNAAYGGGCLRWGPEDCPAAKSLFGAIVLNSNGGAAEYQGDSLGEYVKQEEDYNGHTYYIQRETEVVGRKYLFFQKQYWFVSDTLGGTDDATLMNRQNPYSDSGEPPQDGWEYNCTVGRDKECWNNADLTLGLVPIPLAILKLCQRVEVDLYVLYPARSELENSRREEFTEAVQGGGLGDYGMLEERWSSGRPIYQLENSEMKRYILMMKGHSSWIISSSTTNSTGAWITSGRGALSPTDRNAAGSDRAGVSMWRYFDADNKTWKEGNIFVNCKHYC